jgi:hypothetical protein
MFCVRCKNELFISSETDTFIAGRVRYIVLVCIDYKYMYIPM